MTSYKMMCTHGLNDFLDLIQYFQKNMSHWLSFMHTHTSFAYVLEMSVGISDTFSSLMTHTHTHARTHTHSHTVLRSFLKISLLFLR